MPLNCNVYPNVLRYDNPPNMPGVKNLNTPQHTIYVNCLGEPIKNADYLNQQMGNLRLASASTGIVHNNITEGFPCPMCGKIPCICNINTREVINRILLVSVIIFILYYFYNNYK